MRLSRPKGEAEEFESMFGSVVRDIHPDYERNKAVRGIRTEFLREVVPGCYASHNVLCKNGRYYHGFCITLHQDLPDLYLHSPFVAGGRFDHNHSVNMAIQRDLGRHVILSDSHEFRKGYERIILRCTAEAEVLLLPHYLSVFQRSKEALRALAEHIADSTRTPDDRWAIRRYSSSIHDWDCDMSRFSTLFDEWRGDLSNFLSAVVASKPELFQRLREKAAIDLNSLTK